MTDTELRELLALCEEATPGPWEPAVCYDGAYTVAEMRSVKRLVTVNAPDGSRTYERTSENARLIAAARTALPALIEELLRARAVAEAARLVHDALKHWQPDAESMAVRDCLWHALAAYDDRRTP